MRAGLLATLALALGCSAAGGPGPELRPPLTLSPTPELEAVTRDAAAAWTEATGIEIAIGAGGIPVYADDALESCGMTLVRRLSTGRLLDVPGIAIRTAPPPDGGYCRPPAGTLRHEFGHALQHLASPDRDPGEGHADRGLLAPTANRTQTIDTPALERVCERADCAWMQAEVAQ